MTLIGNVRMGGRQVGVVSIKFDDPAMTMAPPDIDSFVPDLDGYEPEGRAESPPHGAIDREGSHGPAPHYHPAPDDPHPNLSRRAHIHTGHVAPGRPVARGSADTNQAIEDAAKAHHLSPALMKSVASIESGMDPSSNATNSHKFKGLYQIGPDEWRRFGAGGNIYSANDNAMAAAREFDANRTAFHKHFGRDPTDTELYMLHQQGLGFYTRGTMTNIANNLPVTARTPENMTHEGFERYWGGEVERREAQFSGSSASSTSSPRPNYFKGTPPSASDMTQVTTAGGHTFKVNPLSAPALKGFVGDLEKAGAPIADIGGFNHRHIAGKQKWSQHAYGNAIDINQSGRNQTDRAFAEWGKAHASDLRAALDKWNVVSGGDWRDPDWGHFEWGGPPTP